MIRTAQLDGQDGKPTKDVVIIMNLNESRMLLDLLHEAKQKKMKGASSLYRKMDACVPVALTARKNP